MLGVEPHRLQAFVSELEGESIVAHLCQICVQHSGFAYLEREYGVDGAVECRGIGSSGGVLLKGDCVLCLEANAKTEQKQSKRETEK